MEIPRSSGHEEPLQFGYWDSLYKGLLAGETLSMEKSVRDGS